MGWIAERGSKERLDSGQQVTKGRYGALTRSGSDVDASDREFDGNAAHRTAASPQDEFEAETWS